jgi:hypothetical protein
MKHEVEIKDLLVLVYWVKTFSSYEGKEFKHDDILLAAEFYKYQNKPLDTTQFNIDGLMVDGYDVYNRLKTTKKSVFKVLENNSLPSSFNVSKSLIVEEVEKFETVYENLLENYKYDDSEIKNIQINLATKKMKQCVQVEDYENAAKYRDLIKEY